MWSHAAIVILGLVCAPQGSTSFLLPRVSGGGGCPSKLASPSTTPAPLSAASPATTAAPESDVYHPPEEYLESGLHHLEDMEAYLEMYERSIKDPQQFWATIAREFHWHEPFEDDDHHDYNFDPRQGRVSTSFFRGGKTNICYNALDRHVLNGHGDRVAFYTERNELEPTGVHSHPDSYTYAEALKEVSRIANVLKGLGVKKGDKVSIFMPMVSELPLAMLACARIGAVHSVVFAGFSKEALASRIIDAGAKVVITCDGVYRGSKLVPLYNTMVQALEFCKAQEGYEVAGTIVLQRVGPDISKISLKEGRDQYWHDAVKGVSDDCPPEIMDAEDPLFILYTSGSTGKPKGVVHTTGGYMVLTATSFKHVFNYHPDNGDVWFCTADCGWITGHSYIAYGPTLMGATQVVFEGVPSYPDASRLWAIVDKYQVSHLYTAPTAIRSLMREGDHHVKSSSRKSLRVLGSVGEPINPEAWKWYHSVVGDERCPVVDTWWQTETGGIMIAPVPVRGFAQKPGSATLPFFGVKPALLDPAGNEVHGAGEGLLAIRSAWPSTIRTIHGDHERLEQTYFSFPGYYLTGDNARRDADGYYFITGRADDVIIVSGHNIGTAEVESALTTHPAVSEAAVVGRPHDVKGNALYCFITLKNGVQPSKELEQELRAAVRSLVGAFASPDLLHWSPRLPKTRSGKIMRRILRKIAAAGAVVNLEDLGDVSTLAEPDVVQELIASRPSV